MMIVCCCMDAGGKEFVQETKVGIEIELGRHLELAKKQSVQLTSIISKLLFMTFWDKQETQTMVLIEIDAVCYCNTKHGLLEKGRKDIMTLLVEGWCLL